MDPAYTKLRLTLTVLPLFIDKSQTLARACPPDSKSKAFYTRIKSTFVTTDSILTDLHQRSLSATLPAIARDRLSSLLDKLLHLLEKTANTPIAPGQADAFSKLQNLQKPHFQSRHDSCGLLRFQRQGRAETRKKYLLALDRILLRLVDLFHADPAMQSYLMDTAAENRDHGPAGSGLVGDLAESEENVWLIDEVEPVLLHQAIAERWVCQCPSRHKAKLRLTSCYSAGRSGKGVKFDMMLSTYFGHSRWQRACIQLSRQDERVVHHSSHKSSPTPERNGPETAKLSIRSKTESDLEYSAEVNMHKESYLRHEDSSSVAKAPALGFLKKRTSAAAAKSVMKSSFRSFAHKDIRNSIRKIAHFEDVEVESSTQDIASSMQEIPENVHKAGTGAVSRMADLVEITRGGICQMLQDNAQCLKISFLASRTKQGLFLRGGFERSRSPDHIKVLPLSNVLRLTQSDNGSHDRGGDPRLLNASLKSKLILANVLAQAVMQLYGSPWASRRWNKDRLSFALESSRHQSPNAFIELYLSSELDEQQGQGSVDSQQPPHPHPRLLDLGIMLLEIELETPIEQERKPGELGERGQLLHTTDFSVANRLSESDRLSTTLPDYRKAIVSCINTQECTGQGLHFIRGWIKQEIVKPLSQLLLNAFKMRISSDGIYEDGLLLQDGDTADKQIDIPDMEIDSENTPATAVERGQFLDCEKHIAIDKSDKSQMSDVWFERLTQITMPHLDALKKRQTAHLTPNIRIAILDTGIDAKRVTTPKGGKVLASHPALKAHSGRIVDFGVWNAGVLDETNVDMSDSHGHGTHAAALILKVAPHTNLYIAKVDRDKDIFEPDPLSIAEAIKYSTDVWKVDIITMSFGFPSSDVAIYDAITYAHGRNVLMFAAASNGGAIFGETFPATCAQVISVRSADGHGKPSRFNPNPPEHSVYAHFFKVIGENVLSAWPAHLEPSQEKRQTGSSVATPIAAAVVALFLEYVRVRAASEQAHHDHGNSEQLWRRIRYQSSASGIRMALKLMSERDSDGSLYFIKPWLLMSSSGNARWEELKRM